MNQHSRRRVGILHSGSALRDARHHATALALVAAVASCATGYHSRGLGGGYSETQLEPNVWIVSFRGNGYTSDERASDFVLLRSAELALRGGFKYFIVVDRADRSSFGTYTTPSTSNTTASATVYGNTAYGSAQTTTYGGQTFVFKKPGRENTIVCFPDRPNVDGVVFDAQFVWNSISGKYDLGEDSEGRAQGISPNASSAPLERNPDERGSASANGPRRGGCEKDVDCKGDRICEDGRCVSQAAPKPAASPTPGLAPASPPSTTTAVPVMLDAASAEERCAKSDGATCHALGQAFLTGQGAVQSEGEALTLFLKACDKKSADGCGSGSILLNKTGMGSQAANLTNRACELGAKLYCCRIDDNCPGETQCKSGRCVAP
jgi:hypothetical protein